jgi:SAM-dependent methyltransferase
VSRTFADVDGGNDPHFAAESMVEIGRRPAFAAIKKRTYELLGSERPVLDVGCGPGIDVAALAPGAFGVDPSAVMCEAARRRGTSVVRGDAHRLPFATGAFAGVREERTLQHVEDPEVALRELVRVTSAGGRVVAADPDQESLVIRVPSVDATTVAVIKAERRDHQYRHGCLAGDLPDLFRRVGLTDVAIDAFPVVLTDPDMAFGLPSWAAFAHEHGRLDADAVRAWEAGIEEARQDGGFLFVLTVLIVSGRAN